MQAPPQPKPTPLILRSRRRTGLPRRQAEHPYKAGSEVALRDRLNNGNYEISIVPNAEIPLPIAKLMVTGSCDGLS